MNKNKSAWLAWTLCAASSLSAVYGLSLGLLSAGGALGPLAVANGVLTASFAVVFSSVSALIVSRQPRNTIGWLLMVIGLSFAIPTFTANPESVSGAPLALTATELVLAWFSGWSWWLLMGPLLLIILLFPTGRLPSPRWKWVIISLAACFAIFMFFSTFSKTIEVSDAGQTVPNPIGFLSDEMQFFLLVPWGVLLLANAAACVSAILIRYRRAAPVERQQIKWLLLAGVFFLLAFGWSLVYNVLLSQASPPDIVSVFFDLGVLAIPLAIGVAIVRYRLWDIDVIIRRTLVYALLTGLLALAYFGSVLVLQNTFSVLTGQSQSTLVTVLSTLVIAALFVPLRARVQAVIDRRLYRRKYDAARTLAAFGASLRDETNLDQLSARLTDVVDEAMRPSAVNLWLRVDQTSQVSDRSAAHD